MGVEKKRNSMRMFIRFPRSRKKSPSAAEIQEQPIVRSRNGRTTSGKESRESQENPPPEMTENTPSRSSTTAETSMLAQARLTGRSSSGNGLRLMEPARETSRFKLPMTLSLKAEKTVIPA